MSAQSLLRQRKGVREESGSCISVKAGLESTHTVSIVDGGPRLGTRNFTPDFTYLYAVRIGVTT